MVSTFFYTNLTYVSLCMDSMDYGLPMYEIALPRKSSFRKQTISCSGMDIVYNLHDSQVKCTP